MIYIFDKTQAIIKVLTNDDFTAAHLNFKINTATTFEFSLPASKALPSGSKYVATPHPLNDSKFIMLRLTERVDKTETIDYSAYELAYQELATDGYIEDKRPRNQSALNLMKIALDGSNWELNNVNVSGTATTSFYYVDRLSAISKVVDRLGGEIVFYIEIQGNAISGRYMDYLARQGADTSKVFASGSNLLTVERQSDTSNIYTAILPRGKGKEIDNGDADTPDGYGRRINIADVEWKRSAGKPLDKPKGSIVLSDPDATAEWGQINGNARLLLKTYDDVDDVNVLINSAYKTLQSVNHPQIQYSATVADVGGLSLGDTVLIMHGDRDLSYKTRVFEVKYDLLSPDQTELSLGDDLSSNSITSHINNLNAVADTTSSQTQWTINQIGRPGTTYGATAPDSPKVGDIWFKYLPDGGTEIYRWNGDIWELLASPTTADDIAKAVDDAVSKAKSHIDEVKQGLSSDIATAKSQAASQANAAEANAKSEATSQFNQAQRILSEAKKDLTDGIAKEASERNEAVAHANSLAQSIMSNAKSDLMKSIDKEASDRASAVDAANSLAQTYANQAKSDALNTIAKEVTDRQQAVSALDTKAQGYVNTAKSDINDTINALSVGGRNLLLDSQTQIKKPAWYWLNWGWTEEWGTYLGSKIFRAATAWADARYSYKDLLDRGVINTTDDFTYSIYFRVVGEDPAGMSYATIFFLSEATTKDWNVPVRLTSLKEGEWTRIVVTFKFKDIKYDQSRDYQRSIRVEVSAAPKVNGARYEFAAPKLERGSIATDYTPAPEDVVLDYTTKDNKIKETITQYQETNNGKVSKAQTDATTALGLVTTKVSQTDYDKKTGDLSTKYTQVKQTADSQATDIADIKKTATSQASKINSISSDVDGTKQSISDIKKTQDSQSDKVNQITTDVNGTKQSITDIQTKDGKQDTRMGTIETSVSGIKSDFSSYKTTNDGVVKTAQTTAQTAVDGLKNKVSQTDYDKKTGQLQTDLTTTTQTANQATTDITSIKKKDGEQDEKMNTIVSDANGTKQTVSDLQTAQDKQSGYISTLQQRANGFEATVTKVDNLAVGGRNLLLGTRDWTDNTRWDQRGTVTNETYRGMAIASTPKPWWSPRYSVRYANILQVGKTYTFSTYVRNTSDTATHVAPYYEDRIAAPLYTPTSLPAHTDWIRVSITFKCVKDPTTSIDTLRWEGQNALTNGFIQFAGYKLEEGNIATDWTPAPEDVDSTISKVKQTADEAAAAVSKLTSVDGIITKAQADIKVNADAINEKVSKTDFNQKNGELSHNVNEAKNTADKAVQTIGDYKTSNDKRVHEAESSIERTARAITEKISQTDYDQKTGELSGNISTLQHRADGFESTVTKVNNLSVGGRNLLLGTRDWTGTDRWDQRGIVTNETYRGMAIASTPKPWWSPRYSVRDANILQVGKTYTFSTYVRNTSDTATNVTPYYESTIDEPMATNTPLPAHTDWVRVSITFKCVKDPTTSIETLRWEGHDNLINGFIQFAGYKLEEGNVPTDWTPAPEDVDSTVAKVKLTADEAAAAVSKLTSVDGIITKAQADIKVNADAITQKVSKTDYDKKTGELSSHINDVKDTADKSLKTIADIQKADGKQNDRMAEIEQTAEGVKSTVSDLSTAQEKQSGYISTLKQRADGFDATVTKVNNLSVGGRNLLLGTRDWTDNTRWDQRGTVTNETYRGMAIASTSKPWWSPRYSVRYANILQVGKTYTFSTYVRNTSDTATHVAPYYEARIAAPLYTPTSLPAHTDWFRVSVTFKCVKDPTTSIETLRWEGHDSLTNGFIQFAGYKLEEGTIATDWTPAPEDVDSTVAKVKLTADEASAAVIKLTSVDGIITKAQADIKVNADAINEKVSRTDFNQKTGELSHNVNEAKNTADKAVQTIGDYKTNNDKRVHEAESSIERTARAITEKISQTDYDQKTGELSGNISTLQHRADGFESTVTKVNNLSVGGRNLLLGTRDWTDNTRWDQRGTVTKETYRGMVIASTSKPWWSPRYSVRYANILQVGKTYTFSTYVRNTSDTATHVAPYYEARIAAPLYTPTSLPAHTDWFRVSVTFKCVKDPTTSIETLRWEGHDSLTNGFIQFAGYKLEEGTIATDWTPAPEDVDSTVAKVKLTADEASAAVIKLTSVDGIITKAQADIKVNADAINEKVSRTDFNQKTGELSHNVNEAKNTADKAVQTIADYKKNNDKRVETAESSIERTARAITEKISQTDYDQKTGELSGNISTLQHRADGFESTVTKVNNLSIGGRNLLLGTRDWTDNTRWDQRGTVTNETYRGMAIASTPKPWWSPRYSVRYANILQVGKTYTFSTYVRNTSDTATHVAPYYEDRIAAPLYTPTSLPAHTDWIRVSVTFKCVKDPTTSIETLRWEGHDTLTNGFIQFAGYKLEEGNTATDWTPAPEDVQFDIAQVKITADSISNFVRDSSGNISYDFQTALSKTSIITGSTLASSIQNQTSSQISSAITDNNGKIISLINQDSSGVQIAGKNLAITADTTVDGNFWAKQVNAVKVNASNITAGTLNASDVNIINLDVNRLVGNVSNWILSQWTSATGSNVTIDGNGLYFAPGTSRMTTHGFEAWRDDGGRYAAMGMVGSYAWETNAEINGMGLIAKYYDREHNDPGNPYRNEDWGADTIAIGALSPEWGRGYDYVEPFLVFPANEETGNRYYPDNGADTILAGRWLSIYTGINMRGHAISYSSGYSLKENFDSVSGDIALEIFDNTDILTYDYKPDSNDMDDRTAAGMRNKVGFVINDNGQSPYKIDNRLVRYGNSRCDTVTVGYLMAAVKELHAKVKKLESLNAQEKNNATRYK